MTTAKNVLTVDGIRADAAKSDASRAACGRALSKVQDTIRKNGLSLTGDIQKAFLHAAVFYAASPGLETCYLSRLYGIVSDVKGLSAKRFKDYVLYCCTGLEHCKASDGAWIFKHKSHLRAAGADIDAILALAGHHAWYDHKGAESAPPSFDLQKLANAFVKRAYDTAEDAKVLICQRDIEKALFAALAALNVAETKAIPQADDADPEDAAESAADGTAKRAAKVKAKQAERAAITRGKAPAQAELSPELAAVAASAQAQAAAQAEAAAASQAKH